MDEGLSRRGRGWLGKQLRTQLRLDQQRAVDLAVKVALEETDDFRTGTLQLNPMCGRTYTRPPEESMQQAALWDRMWREDQRLQDCLHSNDYVAPASVADQEPGVWAPRA
jgi:hypothetical protein